MKHPLILAAVAGLLAAPASAQRPAPPCCGIIAIDAAAGIVTARVTANGNVFQFKVADSRTLATLKVGQAVYANFAGKQVSLDGRATCCAIISGPAAPAAARPPAPAARAPVAPPPAAAPAAAPPPPPPVAIRPAVPPPAPTAPTTVAGAVSGGLAITAATVNTMPSVTVGQPVPPRTTMRTRVNSRFTSATMTAQIAGRGVSAPTLYLRGLKAVDEAPGLPAGAQRVLKMLVRRVPLGESDHYIVNTKLAQEWILAHPVPESVKPTEPKEKKCGNWYDSWDCATEAVTDEWQRTYDHAVREWDNAEEALAKAWETSLECFTEQTISTGEFPVRFDITPLMTVDLSKSGSKGSAQGTVSGSATLGIPMQSNAAAKLDLFYIPCLPFAIRPKSLSVNGTLTVGQELSATVTATGSFNKTFTLPPTGGPVIPIQIFPIIIAGVPVAEVDISAYIEGEIQVSADGKAEGNFQIKNSNPTGFDFECSGKGCRQGSRRAAPPSATTTNQSAKIEGTVSVKPAVYTALQLDFNYEALSARVGPQPYLLGVASGCAAAAGSQTAGGASTIAENHVLSADLDWGVELRAEALVLGKIVGNSFRTKVMNDKHLWFRDLAPGGSNALMASVVSAGPAVAGKPTDHKVKMPTCYPYTSRVTYEVSWTGGATPAPEPARGPARSPACTWKPAGGGGTCTFNPAQEFAISLVWPAAGTHTLTVVPLKDAHDRVFTPAPKATQVIVSVVP